MAITVTHNFVSPVVDGGEANIVGPDEWNDDHVVTGAADEATQIIAGSGLTGGGTLAADRTLNVGAGDGITVNADDIEIDVSFDFQWTGNHRFGGYYDVGEITEPANPAANTARLFVKDNGSGKTQLCVLFPTGSVTVIATED